MVGWLVSKVFGKEAEVVYHGIVVEEQRNTTRDHRVASDPAEVQIKPLMNTNL
jgi:hypothetical protein